MKKNYARHNKIRVSYLCASVVPFTSWFEIFRMLQVI